MRIGAAAAALGCWLVASLVFGVPSNHPHSTVVGAPVGWALVLLGTLLLFLSLFGISSKYVPRPLAYLGRISYGLYVIHALFLLFVARMWNAWITRLSMALHLSAWSLGTVLALGLTILTAMLSYHLYEKPFLRLKKRFTFVQSRD